MSKVQSATEVNRTNAIELDSLQQIELLINRGLAEFRGTHDPEGFMINYLEEFLGKLEPSDFSKHLKSPELELAISRISVEHARKKPSRRSDKDLERSPAIEALEKATRDGVTKSSEYNAVHAIAIVHLTLPRKRTRDYNLVRNTILKIFQEGIAKKLSEN